MATGGLTTSAFARAVAGASEGLWDWDLAADSLQVSQRWKEQLGLGEESLGTDPPIWFDRLHPDDCEKFEASLQEVLEGEAERFQAEYRMLHADGVYLWMSCRAQVFRGPDGKATALAGSMTDISGRKLVDSLTGLPNRTLLIDRLGRCLERARREPDYVFAVLMVDLDRFKVINDSLGHALGDRLLVEIARRLEEALRAIDTVARLGGDEFTLILDDLDHKDDAQMVADRIHSFLEDPLILDGKEVYATVSVGIALSSKGYDHAEDVLRDADTAMHHAKRTGRARNQTFETVMRLETLKQFHMDTDLRQAIERQEFSVAYQPIVDLRKGTIAGFEALVRWIHPIRGFISPGEFVPVAEELGLIIPIDRFVFGRSCRQLVAWQDAGVASATTTMAVNFSSKQFSRSDLVSSVADVLRDTGMKPACLKLEITESAMMDNPETTAGLLEELGRLGVKLALDDFGTGYSSLSYLHRFPLDVVKIDQSFVSPIGQDGDESPIVRTILTLAEQMSMEVVAEGIETEQQLQLLRGLACTYGQGYFFSKPLPPEDASALLAKKPAW